MLRVDGATAKAKKVFLQLAKVFEERNEVVERMDALQRAAACDPDDAALASEVGAAVAMAERVNLRLSGQEWSAPSSDEEAQVVVRARVLADYGFPDRAKAVLEKSNGVRESVSVRAMMAEVLSDDVSGAIARWRRSPGDRSDIATRVLVLRGDFDSLGTGVEPAEIEMSIEMDDEEEEEEVSLDMEEEEDETPTSDSASVDGTDHESEGDRLVAEGDSEGAIAAYQAALESDPTNESVLMKLGELFAADAGEVQEMPMESLAPIEVSFGRSR